MRFDCKKNNKLKSLTDNNILEQIAKEISSIQKECNVSLDLLQKNINNSDYKTMTLNHYNSKIDSLTNELKILKSKLELKENNIGEKICNLVETYKITFEEVLLQINIGFNSIKLKYENLRKNNFLSISEIDILLNEIIDLKRNFQMIWFKNLKKISKNLLTVISKSNSRVLKKITNRINEIITNNTYVDVLSIDLIVKNYIQNCADSLSKSYNDLIDLYSWLNKVRILSIEKKEKLKNNEKLTKDNIPPRMMYVSNNKNEVHDKLSDDIQNIKEIVKEELSKIRKDNLEHENKLRIFLENESNKHDKTLNDIRNDYQSSLLKEQQSMLSKIDDALQNESQKIIDSKIIEDKKDFDDVYCKITNEFKNILNEDIEYKKNVLKNKFNSINDEIEKKIDKKLEELNSKNLSIEDEKQTYLHLLKEKINNARNKSNLKNSNQENIEANFIQNNAVDTNDNLNLNSEKLDVLINEITKQVVNKFNLEVEKIKSQNTLLNNPNPYVDFNNYQQNFMQDLNNFLPLSNNINDLNQASNILPDFMNMNDFSNVSFQEEQNIQAENSIENFDSSNDESSNNDAPVSSRKVRFVGSNTSNNGRLSNEDIRNYANSIINANRKKALESK